jgi:hypothetical protein
LDLLQASLLLTELCGLLFHRKGRPVAGDRLFEFDGAITDLNQAKSTEKNLSETYHVNLLAIAEESFTHACASVRDVAKKLRWDNQRRRSQGRCG